MAKLTGSLKERHHKEIQIDFEESFILVVKSKGVTVAKQLVRCIDLEFNPETKASVIKLHTTSREE